MAEKLAKLKKQTVYLERRLDDLYVLSHLMNNMYTEDSEDELYEDM